MPSYIIYLDTPHHWAEIEIEAPNPQDALAQAERALQTDEWQGFDWHSHEVLNTLEYATIREKQGRKLVLEHAPERSISPNRGMRTALDAEIANQLRALCTWAELNNGWPVTQEARRLLDDLGRGGAQ